MHLALVPIAMFLAMVGAVFTSNATSGVAIIAVACLVAIFARIAQAGHQHKALMTVLTHPEDFSARQTPRTSATPADTNAQSVSASESFPAALVVASDSPTPRLVSRPVKVFAWMFAAFVVIGWIAVWMNDTPALTRSASLIPALVITLRPTATGWEVKNNSSVPWQTCALSVAGHAVDIPMLPTIVATDVLSSAFSDGGLAAGAAITKADVSMVCRSPARQTANVYLAEAR